MMVNLSPGVFILLWWTSHQKHCGEHLTNLIMQPLVVSNSPISSYFPGEILTKHVSQLQITLGYAWMIYITHAMIV